MQSIKTKLIQSFVITIVVLLSVCVVSISVFITSVNKYRTSFDTMITEYQLIEATSNLSTSYNLIFKSGSNFEVDYQNYLKNKKQIENIYKTLDNSIVGVEVKSDYLGLKNTINNVISETDFGIEKIHMGDISNASDYLDSANSKFEFVQENGNKLILGELKQSSSIRQTLLMSYVIALIGGAVTLVVTTIGCVFFAVKLSDQITKPLKRLSDTAQKISSGDMDVDIDADLLKLKDETGSLSNSFNMMIQRLKKHIEALNVSNKDLVEAKNKVEGSVAEITKMNKLMVNRELNMIKLKEEIRQLRGEAPVQPAAAVPAAPKVENKPV